MATTLLVVGDGGAPTGYARVVHNILRHLPKGAYEIHHLAVNYAGDPHEEDWKLYPAAVRGDIFGVNRIKELVEKLRPQLVFSVADLWIQKLYLDALGSCAQKPKIVTYSPVDAGPVDPEWVEKFRGVSRVMAFTNYARSEILKALEPEDAPAVDVIPLGVEREMFFPLSQGAPSSTTEAKRMLKLFPESEIEDSFLVLNAHRNQPRKRIDITLKGFAAFAQGKPRNVQLYLHMGRTDMGWDVLKLAKRYGIDDRLIVSENRGTMPGIQSEHLNLVYNASDVGLNTATGEGWGLPNFEHAATGKAQVVPRFGALAELWSESAEFIEPSGEVVYEVVLSEGKAVSVAAVAAALERLYSDCKHRRHVADACYRRVTTPDYQWTKIAKEWHEIFEEVLAANGKSCAVISGSEITVQNKKAELLLKALEEAPPGFVVEIGSTREAEEKSYDGFSTYYLARRCKELGRPFRSFDVAREVVRVANSGLEKTGLPPSVELGNGKEVLPGLGPIAFLYLDSSDDPRDTLEQWLASELLPGAVVVVDDAHEYGGNSYGKATLLVESVLLGVLPQIPHTFHRTEPGYTALVLSLPQGKNSGVMTPCLVRNAPCSRNDRQSLEGYRAHV